MDQQGPPNWADAPAGSMVAIELCQEGVRRVEINSGNAMAEIVDCVGDPRAAAIGYLRDVQFWTGANCQVTSPYNFVASWGLLRLLAAVRDGRCIVTNVERRQVSGLLGSPGAIPDIHGRCLITGVGEKGAPAPLDKTFQGWLNGVLAGQDPMFPSLGWAPDSK